MEYKFLQAMYQCDLLYGVNFTNEDDFCEIALNGWGIIGNKLTKLYRYKTGTGDDNEVELPCNCDFIEAVLAPHEDWNYVTATTHLGDYESEFTEEWIEMLKKDLNPLYGRGHYVHYNKIGKTLYFSHPYPELEIIYKGIVLDEDDLPMLNEKEMNAIATYVAYVKTYKEGLMTKNSNTINLSKDLERKWSLQCVAARVPDVQLSQNEFNEIADAKSRWPGKRYGRSYKPLMK